MSYTDQTTIENYLVRELTTSESSILSLYLTAVDNYINSELGSGWGTISSSARYYNGDNTTILDIDPCIDLTQIRWTDSTENTNYTYLKDEDYEQFPRNEDAKYWIELRTLKFPKGVANIEVTAEFTRGADIPSDIKLAATMIVSGLIENASSGNLERESIEGYSYSIKSYVTKTAEVSMILEQYNEGRILI